MSKTLSNDLHQEIIRNVTDALAEDIGPGDITAELIPTDQQSKAKIITREQCVLCGTDWVNETFSRLDRNIKLQWHIHEGELAQTGDTILEIEGNTRALLTGERTALNFLQLLSAVATKAHTYKSLTRDTQITILDTRKTIPGLRFAQKYAVKCGGCSNHRIGLHDAFLIKENHIQACGSIEKAISHARAIAPKKLVEIEVETLEELRQAISSRADVVMLDNFDSDQLHKASLLERGKTKFEISGNITSEKLEELKKFRVDFISIGDLTKNIRAVDLSMRLT